MHIRKATFILGIMCFSMAYQAFSQLAHDGERFKLDEQLLDMWGIRVASTSQTDEQADHLIA